MRAYYVIEDKNPRVPRGDIRGQPDSSGRLKRYEGLDSAKKGAVAFLKKNKRVQGYIATYKTDAYVGVIRNESGMWTYTPVRMTTSGDLVIRGRKQVLG